MEVGFLSREKIWISRENLFFFIFLVTVKVRLAKDENVDDNDCMEVGQMRLGHPRPAESDPSLLWVGAISKGIHNPLLMKHLLDPFI